MTTQHSAAPTRWKVLIVDDHPVVREALGTRLNRESDFEVCETVGRAAEVERAIAQHHPDIMLLDLSLPDGHGLDLAKDVRVAHPEVRVLIFSMHEEQLYGERALRAGARGYLMKDESPERLIEAMRRVLAGEIVVSPILTREMLRIASRKQGNGALPSLDLLSDRELEVFHLIGTGMTTKEIADKLSRGVKTIETHRLRLKEKLGIKSHAELIARAASWNTLGAKAG